MMSYQDCQPLYKYHEEELIALFVETLTGTTFEMTVSPYDTIMSIKSKIQRVEGIPVSQQHLLYNLHELEDSAALMDYSITNGSTIKLVISMRGGPISTVRRILPLDDVTLRELVDFNRDDFLEDVPPGCRMAVLVFREGDHLNMFRVLENIDGTYSPLSDSWSGSSMRNLFEEDDSDESTKQRLEENTVTMEKMNHLKSKLEQLAIQRRNNKLPRKDCQDTESSVSSVQSEVRKESGRSSGGGRRKKNFLQLPPLRADDSDVSPEREPQERLRKTRTAEFSRVPVLPDIAPSPPSIAVFDSDVASVAVPRPKTSPDRLTGHQICEILSEAGRHRILGAHHCSTTPLHGKMTSVLAIVASQLKYMDQYIHDFGCEVTVMSYSGYWVQDSPEEAINACAFHAVCLNLGCNNLPREKPSEVVVKYQRLIRRILAVSSCDLFVLSVLPRSRNGYLPRKQQVADEGRIDLLNTKAMVLNGVLLECMCDHIRPIRNSDNNYESEWFNSGRLNSNKSLEKPSTSATLYRSNNTLTDKKFDRSTVVNPFNIFQGRNVNGTGVSSLFSSAKMGKVAMHSGGLRRTVSPHTAGGKPNKSAVALARPSVDIDPIELKSKMVAMPTANCSKQLPSLNNCTLSHSHSDTLAKKAFNTDSNSATDSVATTKSECLSSLVDGDGNSASKPLPKKNKREHRSRCAKCHKRLTVTNTYTCRCGRIFCTNHRYSEAHECTYDYKSEGRRILEQNNPLISAPKLPKI